MLNRILGGERKLSRRQMLGGAGAAAAATVVGASPAGAAEAAFDDGTGWQGGVFEGMVSEDSFRFRRAYNNETAVYTLADDARVFHGKPAAITDFADGEEMTLFVDDGERRTVSEVEFLNRPVAATIKSRNGDTIQTSVGTLQLGAATRAVDDGDLEARPLDELAEGDRIVALGQLQPNSRTLNVSTVGVVSDGDGR